MCRWIQEQRIEIPVLAVFNIVLISQAKMSDSAAWDGIVFQTNGLQWWMTPVTCTAPVTWALCDGDRYSRYQWALASTAGCHNYRKRFIVSRSPRIGFVAGWRLEGGEKLER